MRLPHVVDVARPPFFPEGIVPDEYGLIAVGGRLTEPVLLEAYTKGIFPWFDQPPILWYSPDPRMILYTGRFHLSRRTARVLRQQRLSIRLDTDFAEVIEACSTVPRPAQDGTWITEEMRSAYTALHGRGFAHCVSVYDGADLVGGLYGLCLGAAFFGESMFSSVPGASKVAFYSLHRWAVAKGLAFVDCQLPTPHLASLGAVEVPRGDFLRQLAEALTFPTLAHSWAQEGRDLFLQSGV